MINASSFLQSSDNVGIVVSRILSNWSDNLLFLTGGNWACMAKIKYKGDDGYLVVNAFYEHEQESIEDYIDRVPILEDLYIDPKEFLK